MKVVGSNPGAVYGHMDIWTYNFFAYIYCEHCNVSKDENKRKRGRG